MAIVDLVLTAGQSQMSGVGNGAEAPSCSPALCWDWTSSGFVTIKDPNSSSGAYKAQTGSPIPAFANTWTASTGRPLAVVRAAVGGTALLAANASTNGYWDTNGGRFNDSVSLALAAIADLQGNGHTLGHVFVIWSQGYRDAVGGQNLGSYQAAQGNLVSRWRSALSQPSLKVFIEQMYAPAAANPTVAARCLTIRDAQLAALAETEGLEMGFTEGETFASRGWLKPDQLHYNQTGLNYMGQAFADAVLTSYDIEPEPPGPVPTSPSSAVGRLLMQVPPVPPVPPLPKEWTVPGFYSWTCPALVTEIQVEAWGGGGGGRGGVILSRGGMGGGGGQYRIATVSVTPGITYDIVVGVGGNGSSFNSNDGTNGASSKFGTLVEAVGGNKPPTASAGAPATSGGTGGVATEGEAGGISGTALNSPGAAGGKGGGSEGGAGGAGGTNEDPPGKPGEAPGGGGGGGRGNIGQGVGGNGGGGRVRITGTA